jgi:hypothetical protein
MQLPARQMSRVQALLSVAHTAPSALKTSCGQVVAPPHVSSASHSPAAGRQTVAAGAALCVQAVPVHTSVVQELPSLEHACPFLLASAGQVRAPPQVSSTSHSPTAGRQTVLAAAAEHVPSDPCLLHVSQTPPLQAPSQHTPSTQNPVVHSEVPEHCLPLVFFAKHTPEAQNSVAAHWPSFMHPTHTSPAQLPVGQVSVWAAGHAPELPVHVVTRLATPAVQLAIPHTVEFGLKSSVGQELLEPSHFSSTSQTSTAGRQGWVLGCLASAQVVDAPVHLSSRSQGPLAARQTVPEFPALCWHELFVPSQVSVVHGLPSSVQAVAAIFFTSAGQLSVAPSQRSSSSHSPVAARQTCVAGCLVSAHALELPLQVSARSQGPLAARQTAPGFPTACAHTPD